MRPQKYNPTLGIQGNLENALWENQYRKNEISNEQSARYTADEQNLLSMQADMVEAVIDEYNAICE